jgi:hypothetical protein
VLGSELTPEVQDRLADFRQPQVMDPSQGIEYV